MSKYKYMKHYLIYQIRNKLNNMIYVGQHQTENIDDGYMGSGLRIQYAIKKYGIENFEKTILFECQSEDEMNAKEAEIVNEDFIARDDVYNIELGGIGGWTHLSKDSKSKASKTRWQNMSDLERKQSIDAWKNSCKGRTHTIEERQRMSESLKRFYANNPTRTGMSGKHHTEQTKQKLSQSHTGNKNPSFGKMWICNDKTHQSKTILKTESIPDGWRKGRFCK